MAGQLQKHPYYRTWDELQRSMKRMNTYLDMNFKILSDEEKEAIQIMIEGMEKAVRCVPEEYRVTKHFQYKEKE